MPLLCSNRAVLSWAIFLGVYTILSHCIRYFQYLHQHERVRLNSTRHQPLTLTVSVSSSGVAWASSVFRYGCFIGKNIVEIFDKLGPVSIQTKLELWTIFINVVEVFDKSGEWFHSKTKNWELWTIS